MSSERYTEIELPASSFLAVSLREPVGIRNRWSAAHCAQPLPPPLCLPIENDLAFRDGAVRALVEFYGGAGLGANAGGVRAANVWGVQIKGIGRTALASPATDKWHRHGALSLQDALRETIMGELFHIASPYGAVRALGIDDLGSNFATEIGEAKTPGTAPRALLLRQQCVRVGQFMRSSFARVEPEVFRHELARMQAAIPVLASWFCWGQEGGGVSLERVAIGLVETFHRLMRQVAVLRTKRLVHGSLIPSNFCFDGRLLDFTTSTAISTLQPVLVSLGGLSSQQQHTQVLDAVFDLLFYASKFDSRCWASMAEIKCLARDAVDRLASAHHEYLMAEHLRLFGFSDLDISLIESGTRAELLAILISIISSGPTFGGVYFGGDEHSMVDQHGLDDPFSLVARAISVSTGVRVPNLGDFGVDPSLFSDSLLGRLIDGLSKVLSEISVKSKNNEQDLVEIGIAWLIRAMRLSGDLSGLYRRNLDEEINDVCQRGDDFGVLIKKTCVRFSGQLDYSGEGLVPLQGWLLLNRCDLQDDNSVVGDDFNCSVRKLCNFEPSPQIPVRHKWLIETFRLNCN